MYAWIARWLVRRTVRKHIAGDVSGLLESYADDVHFRFPGRNSWNVDIRGKEAVRAWLERFHRVGLMLEVHEILVKGPPWNTVICLQFTDHLKAPDGRLVYENRGVIYGRGAWGKITDYEVFEDTEKVADLDRYLETVDPGAGVVG